MTQNQNSNPHVMGIDPAALADYCALAVVEVITEPKTEAWHDERHYHVRYLKRLALGGVENKYQKIHTSIVSVYKKLANAGVTDLLVVIDATGAGYPVLEAARSVLPYATVRGCIWTGGSNASVKEHGRIMHVPKQDLITALRTALATGNLHLPQVSRFSHAVKQELNAYEYKIRDNNTFSMDARSGAHDDLISALAMCIYAVPKKKTYLIGHVGEGLTSTSREAALFNKFNRDPFKLF